MGAWARCRSFAQDMYHIVFSHQISLWKISSKQKTGNDDKLKYFLGGETDEKHSFFFDTFFSRKKKVWYGKE